MNRLHKLTLAILAASFTCLAQAADAPKTMRGADIPAGDPAPEVKAYAGKKPGLQQPIARTYKEQPPVIPHAVDNFDEITLKTLCDRGVTMGVAREQDHRFVYYI